MGRNASHGASIISHKADDTFFDEKREWSERKDRILRSYLTAYLPKMATQGKPILIVDCFAGPGSFDDGEPGSPLIISEVITNASLRERPLKVDVALWTVEKKDFLYQQLQNALLDYTFAKSFHRSFTDMLPAIIKQTDTHNVFLYIDPFTVEGLEWEPMSELFQQVGRRKSVEILLNFNAASFGRRALAALKQAQPNNDPEFEDFAQMDAPFSAPPSIENLDKIVGGSWWQEIFKLGGSFETQIKNLSSMFCKQLANTFNEVCHHSVKAEPQHKIPKYDLIFASRHPDALVLMNDEMVKSRNTLADKSQSAQLSLFENRPKELVPEKSRLTEIVLASIVGSMKRGEAIVDVVRKNFGMFSSADMRREIKQLLKKSSLISETGKFIINDTTLIWRAES